VVATLSLAALVRAGLRVILSSAEDLAVVGEAADGAEAVALISAHRAMRPILARLIVRHMVDRYAAP
jgi:DNA-binding NarL/FixJ family response regulator